MSVQQQTPVNRYTGNGVTTVYATSYKALAKTDVGVSVNGVLKTVDVDFMVAGLNNDAGFSVTFTVAPASLANVVIYRATRQQRGTDYQQSGDFLTPTVNPDFDNPVLMIQELQEQASRALTLPITDAPASLTGAALGSVDNRKGKYLFFNAVTGAIEYALNIINTTLSQSIIAQLLNPQDPTEIANAVIPTFYTYRTSPKRDVRRHLTSAWDSGGLNTTGLQTAINLTYAQKGRLILPHGLDITTGGVSQTMPGNRATQGLAIEGPGWNGARITQVGAPTALLTMAGSTPASNPSEAPLVMEGFSLVGLNGATHGILLNGIGYWRLSGVQVRNFNAGIYLKSALLGVINDNCMSNENQYGLLAERDGALPFPAGGSGCNRVTVSDSVFNLNTVFGLFLQSGENWALENLDIEGNGTVGNVNTGGIRLTGLLDDDIGVAQVACRSLWMESNKGTPFLVDACPGLILSIRDTLMLNSGVSTSEILIAGADRVSIEDTMAPAGGGAIWDITATYLTLKNTKTGTLTDGGVVNPNYRNASTGTGTHIKGRTDSYTGTLTGCTTSPTGTVFLTEDGNEITVEFRASLLATSNTNACTVTGMPVRFRPSAQRITTCGRITDNGISDIGEVRIETSGVLTFFKDANSAAFTAAGLKGVSLCSFVYRK